MVKGPIVLVVVLVAACGEPTPLQCTNDVTCGDGACIGGFCAAIDLSCTSGLRYHESAGELAGECAGGSSGSGSGSGGADAFRVLGETNFVDASMARDDLEPSCASAGGRDVMFDVSIKAIQRLYVDTFGTDYSVVLAVYKGKCSSLTAASTEISCVAASCSDSTKQWSEVLSPGDYCIVVDEGSMRDLGSYLVVRSKVGLAAPAGRVTDGTGAPNAGSTCSANQVMASCNPTSAGEAAWFFMSCGSQSFFADTCVDTDYAGYLTAHGLGLASLACGLGCNQLANGGIRFTVSTPSPIWLIADDSSMSACSTVETDVTVGMP